MIVHMKQYDGRECDLWAIVVPTSFNPGMYSWDGTGYCGDIGQTGIRQAADILLDKDQGRDRYELVPDENVPDWVWAELMKRALTCPES